MVSNLFCIFFFSSRRRHTRCALVTGVQTCALPIFARMEGQLTATLQMDDGDQADAAKLLPTLSRKVGRVLANGWPTGVEVTHAMVHGGPFPSTSDGRSTSVGTLAMMRLLRPVCRSAGHTSALQSLMRISYAAF